jgi:hypothetical protein
MVEHGIMREKEVACTSILGARLTRTRSPEEGSIAETRRNAAEDAEIT